MHKRGIKSIDYKQINMVKFCIFLPPIIMKIGWWDFELTLCRYFTSHHKESYLNLTNLNQTNWTFLFQFVWKSPKPRRKSNMMYEGRKEGRMVLLVGQQWLVEGATRLDSLPSFSFSCICYLHVIVFSCRYSCLWVKRYLFGNLRWVGIVTV